MVGAGERATSSGGAIMQMLRQAGYGGRVVPVNPKGGSIFGYEAVTSIAAIDRRVQDVKNGRGAGCSRNIRASASRSDDLSDVQFRDRRGA